MSTRAEQLFSQDGSFREVKINALELAVPSVLERQVVGEGFAGPVVRDAVDIQVMLEFGDIADVATRRAVASGDRVACACWACWSQSCIVVVLGTGTA